MNDKSVKFVILALLTALLSCTKGDRGPWVPLFNGSDFSEFEQLGGKAPYRVKDGVITGSSMAHTENSFMCTRKSYGDFILEFKVLVDTALNSGVQIRSHAYVSGRVHGYQVEIDPAARAWSGGLYDEARRGWLFDLSDNPAGRAAFHNNQWNKYRVEAIGNSIKTWVNGVMCTNLVDEADITGFIAFQVHSLDLRTKPWSEGSEVKWKDIRIMTGNLEPYRFHGMDPVPVKVAQLTNRLSPTEQEEGWQLLFDGENTDSWRAACMDAFPDSGWQAGDGTLEFNGEGGGQSGEILTRESYSNFDLKLDFRMSPDASGGIRYFVAEEKKDGCPAGGLEYRLACDTLNGDAGQGTGGSGTLASLYNLIPAKNRGFFRGPGKWNMARIVSQGNVVTHWLNGQKVLEYNRDSGEFRKLVRNSGSSGWKDSGNPASGPVLLQGRAGGLAFKNIKIRKLE